MKEAEIPAPIKSDITLLFERMADAWNAGDAEAFAACFTEEAHYVTFAGQHLTGRKAIEEVHQELFSGLLKGSTLVGDSLTVHFLNPHVAVAHAVGTVKLRWQKKAPKGHRSINTNVVIREGREWKIAAFHNCRVRGPNLIEKVLLRLAKK